MNKYISYSLLSLTMLSANVEAAPKLSSPQVTAGKAEAEVYGEFGRSDGDTFNDSTLKLKYGINERWKAEIGADISYWEGDGWNYDATGIKLHYEMTEEGPYYFGSALQIGYELGSNGNGDNASLDLLVEKNIQDIEVLANFGLSQGLSNVNDNETDGSFDIGVYKPYLPNLGLGLEYYADFGDINDTGSFNDQSHQIGPMVKYQVGNAPIKFELGVLAGLSDAAPDVSLRYVINYSF